MNNDQVTINRQYSVLFLVETTPIFFIKKGLSNDLHIKWWKIWFVVSFGG